MPARTRRAKKRPRLFGGRWRQVRGLRRGGQGTTFVVTDTSGEEPGEHVLKLLHLPGKKATARFQQEVTTVKSLAHPQIVRIVDAVLDRRELFYVMPHYAKGSLDRDKERWYKQPGEALRFFESLCETAAIAHTAGVTHRDIKPANILLDDQDRPVLADFGICYVENGERRTLSEEAVGARKWIAPELEEGRAELVGPPSDVYSLGKVLYWMLSGGRVFAREQRYFTAPDSLDTLFPHDDRYRQVTKLLLQRSITENRGSRFANAGEFAAEVRRVAFLFEAGDAARIVVVSGDGQTTVCGSSYFRPSATSFNQPLVARMEDDGGRPIANREVWWTGDNGQFTEQRTVTDLDGLTRTYWRPTGVAGDFEVRATSRDVEPAVFRGRVRPGAADRFVPFDFSEKIERGGTHEFLVRAIDGCGNPTPDSYAPHYRSDLMMPADQGVWISPVKKEGLEPGVFAFIARAGQRPGRYSFSLKRGIETIGGVIFEVVGPEKESG